MSCGISPSGRLVSSGGLDNVITVHALPDELIRDLKAEQKDLPPARIHAELNAHEGYISSCAFIGDDKVFSTSGDSTCCLFDLETQFTEKTFKGHRQDVMNATVMNNQSCIISCSVDTTSRLWDLRDKSSYAKMVFRGHESDVNTVKLFSNDTTFVSGSDDSTCRLFDLRVGRQINLYQSQNVLASVQSVDVSSSGRYIFSAYDIPDLWVWDSLLGEPVQVIQGAHDNRVSALQVSPNGQSLATGSWDNKIKIWA